MSDRPSDLFNRSVFTQVINLDESEDRLAAIAGELDRVGIAHSRHKAVDGRVLDLETDPLATARVDLAMWRKRHHRNPLAAEVGCYLSHVQCLEAFLAGDKPLGFIMEDDAQLADDFVDRVLPAVLKAEDWDILKLHARHPGPLVTRRIYTPQSRLCSFVTRHAGAAAYIVNRRAANRMLTHLQPAIKAYDWVYDDGHRMGLRVRTLGPMPVTLRAVPSTIEVHRKKPRRTGLERHSDRPLLPRWSLPFRRMGDGVFRLIYNLLQDGGLLATVSAPKRD